MAEWVSIAAALGAGGIIVAVIQAVVLRRKTRAEATDVVTQAVERVVAMITADNERLRAEVGTLTVHVDGLKAEVHALRHENEQLLAELARIHPGWRDPS